MAWQDFISVDPAVVHGQACIRGTRIPVAVVLANLADGLTAEDLIRSYPALTIPAIQAALAYAAACQSEARVLSTLDLDFSDIRTFPPAGLGPVPPLAGRSPSYTVRQLFDMQQGMRKGPWSALMKSAVEKLTVDDMIAIAAYTASREP